MSKSFMGRKFREQITHHQLALYIVEAMKKHEEWDPEDLELDHGPEHHEQDMTEFLINNSQLGHSFFATLNAQVMKDLRKVDFSTENLEWLPGEAYGNVGGICGFQTLPNGLTYLGVTAGGDWESPLFFIIYHDGQKLRAYIPKDGNTWNLKTKMAYGNAEGENAKVGFNTARLLADITNRIKPLEITK